MFRRFVLAAAVFVGTALAMAPNEADARWGRRFYRAPIRVGVGYVPPYSARYHSPRRTYYGPRYAPRAYYGPQYYRSGYRYGGYGGVGVNFGRGGIYYSW